MPDQFSILFVLMIARQDPRIYYQKRLAIQCFGHWKYYIDQNKVYEEENDQIADEFYHYYRRKQVFRKLQKQVTYRQQSLKSHGQAKYFREYILVIRYLRYWRLFHLHYHSKHRPVTEKQDETRRVLLEYLEEKRVSRLKFAFQRLRNISNSRQQRGGRSVRKNSTVLIETLQRWKRTKTKREEREQLYGLCSLFAQNRKLKRYIMCWRSKIVRKEFSQKRYRKYDNLSTQRLIQRYIKIWKQHFHFVKSTKLQLRECDREAGRVSMRALLSRWKRFLEERNHQRLCNEAGYVHWFAFTKLLRLNDFFALMKEKASSKQSRMRIFHKAKIFYFKQRFQKFQTSILQLKQQGLRQILDKNKADYRYYHKTSNLFFQYWREYHHFAGHILVQFHRARSFYDRKRKACALKKLLTLKNTTSTKRKQLLQSQIRYKDHQKTKALYLLMHRLFGRKEDEEDDEGVARRGLKKKIPRFTFQQPSAEKEREEDLDKLRVEYRQRVFLRYYLLEWKAMISEKRSKMKETLEIRQKQIFHAWSHPNSHYIPIIRRRIREEEGTSANPAKFPPSSLLVRPTSMTPEGTSIIDPSPARNSQKSLDEVSKLARTPPRISSIQPPLKPLTNSPCSITEPFKSNSNIGEVQAVLRECEGEDPLVSTILNERRKLLTQERFTPSVTGDAPAARLDAETREQLSKVQQLFHQLIASWGTEPLTREHEELIEEVTNLLKEYEF